MLSIDEQVAEGDNIAARWPRLARAIRGFSYWAEGNPLRRFGLLSHRSAHICVDDVGTGHRLGGVVGDEDLGASGRTARSNDAPVVCAPDAGELGTGGRADRCGLCRW